MVSHQVDKRGFFYAVKLIGIFIITIYALHIATDIGFRYMTEANVETYRKEAIDIDFVLLKKKQRKELLSYLQGEASGAVNADVTLAFVGDLMFDRGVKKSVEENGKGDYRFLFTNVQTRLSSYDVLFGNLEGPLSDKGNNQGSLYSFRMDPISLDALTYAGFDVVSVANNHFGDWGTRAMEDTLSRLSAANILYAGGGKNKKEAYSATFASVGGMSIAYLAFSELSENYEAGLWRSGTAIAHEKEVRNAIRDVGDQADFIIVSFHFGEEYDFRPTLFQRDMSHLAIDEGADLVVGHHSHVIGLLEKYKNAYIAYGLGNFIFDQIFSPETMEGMLLLVGVSTDGNIVYIRPFQTRQNAQFQASIYNLCPSTFGCTIEEEKALQAED